MKIEIGAPASMPLGYVMWQGPDDRLTPVLLGITLQHPPLHLMAQANNTFSVTGARANIGRAYAQRFLAHYQLKGKADVQIELAIPAYMGLSSEPIMGLSVAQALSWVYEMPYKTADTLQFASALDLKPHDALALWGYAQGGLLLVEATAESKQTPSLIQRHEIDYTHENDAWAFVFYFPRVSSQTTAVSLEADRLQAGLQATAQLSVESGSVAKELFTAVSQKDFSAFGQSLMSLQAMNQEALTAVGKARTLSETEQGILAVMQENGAVAWGQMYAGLGFYGLVYGGQASRVLRKKIQDYVGYGGGIVMATIAANSGARAILQDELGYKTVVGL